MIIVIIIIIITLLAVLAFSFHLFRIERVDTPIPDAPGQSGDEGSQDGENPDGESGEDEEGKESEMVDVFEYFNEDEENEGEEEEKEHQDAGGNYGTPSDKITDFNVGHKYLLECKKMLECAKDEGHIYCAAYFDFDRFSYINSLKGAATGDYVLTQTGQQLRQIFPEGALMTRVSCDHFALIFPLVDLELFEDYYEQLRRMCEKIRADIAAKAGLRICVGFATTDNDSSYDVNVLLSRANVARHCAKVTKAEKFETYDETMITSNFFGDTLMENYAECQYSDSFAIYFENQVDLVSDKIVGCDTLVRWDYDDNQSTPITQDTGHIPTNNDKVIYQACRAMSRWRKAAREIVTVFVDVPITDLFKADIDEFILKCITEFQIDPQSLAVKINVSSVRMGWSMCSKQFKKFHELGIKICLTNIDTGYTNLEFLMGLSVDLIKLNKSFAHNVDKNPEQRDKCRKMIERASAIGAKVIFEGVDNMEQVAALRTINVKTVQGKYSGKPNTADDLIRTLPEHVERRGISDQTVILDESEFARGNWQL